MKPDARIEMTARDVADDVVAYEREEGFERDDAFRTPEDVREYADRYGWLDGVDDYTCADVCSWEDDEITEFERMVTEFVIEALFN